MSKFKAEESFGLTTSTGRYIVVFGVDKKAALRRFDSAYRHTDEEEIVNYKQITDNGRLIG